MFRSGYLSKFEMNSTFRFVVEKPTSTTKMEKKLEMTDLPEVVICIVPGLNPRALKIMLDVYQMRNLFFAL